MILTIHYIMKNSRGEKLEESTTSIESTTIAPYLQSQLAGLQPTDRKTIFLPKGTEGADDDFIFEVTVISANTSTKNPRIHLLSGFLGAGKTTAIEHACRYLQKQNTSIAVITNDQGFHLVDGSRFLQMRIPSREVTGGCFCCNYTHLDDSIRSLINTHHPSILFAESVGSCTDLIATVLKPLLDEHPEWQPTVTIVADANLLDDTTADPSIRYIYNKQLEEAQVLLITRSETYPTEWKDEIRSRFPNAIVLFHNSYHEADIIRWLDTLTSLPARPTLPSLEIDYDTYAEGEARLAWLDQKVHFDSPEAAQHLMQLIADKIKKENYPVGRLKYWLAPPTLLINARVQTDPPTLSQLVSTAIAETNARYATNIQTLTAKAFQPGYPRPTHRFA